MDPNDGKYADTQGNRKELEPTLLAETIEIMVGYSGNDICFIGLPDDGYACTWDEFTEMAKDIRVRTDLPRNYIYDLEIHFVDGGKLIREDNDDSGWIRIHPVIKSYSPDEFRKLTTLNINKLRTEKKELLELQRLKSIYE